MLAGGLWAVHADANQLENAIVNLAVNARDAMPDGGRLTIETANCRLDEVYAAEHAIAGGQYVMIAVTDTDTGMSPEVLKKAFDPFNTTKPTGKGTGLTVLMSLITGVASNCLGTRRRARSGAAVVRPQLPAQFRARHWQHHWHHRWCSTP